MKNSILFHLLLLMCVLLNSCISDLDIDTPASQEQAVLNCILQNDSAVVAQLYWATDAAILNPILEANISLYAEGEFLEEITKSDSKGNYRFMHLAKPNCNYSIKANYGNIELSAQSTSPLKPTISAKRKRDENENYFIYTVSNKDIAATTGALYFYIYNEEKGYDEEDTSWVHQFISCNSPYADSFNAASYSWGPKGFYYLYDYFVRVDANSENIVLDLAAHTSSYRVKLRVVTVNSLYDTYFKSAFIQRYFDPEVNLPFSYYPVPIPSNVNGGIGIFAGVDITEFMFEAEAEHE